MASTAMLFSGDTLTPIASVSRKTNSEAGDDRREHSNATATSAQRTRLRCFLSAWNFFGSCGLPTSSE